MRPFKKLISAEEALKKILENVKEIERKEEVPITACCGRVLAQEVIAEIDVPPFSRAAEDGYALRAEETYGASRESPKIFKVIGKVHAGEVPSTKVKPGTAIEVATGAMIPEGANAVVRVEDTELFGDELHVYTSVPPGNDISPAGEDVKRGEKVLSVGTLLGPPQIGVLAALGISKVKVFERPKVAIISTGNEIVPPGKPLSPGQIYDVNTYTLASVISENGGIPVIVEKASDEKEELRKALNEAMKYDMVVFSGGSSVGTRDLLVDVIGEEGEIIFHGVKIKPGKPTLFALVNGKPVLGMPGFPTSCLSNAYYFLVPALRKMARLPKKEWRKVKAKMAQRITSTLGRMQIFTVRVEGETAFPVFKKSGTITSLSRANGFIIIPEEVDLIERGEEVEVYLLERNGSPARIRTGVVGSRAPHDRPLHHGASQN